MAVSKRCRVWGKSIHYLEAGNGPTVVLVHGIGGGSGHWMLNIDALAERFRVIAVDLLGFGDSDPPDDFRKFDQKTLVDFFIGFLDVLEIESASLVGTSMGGGLVLIAALEIPERVSKLVLVDAAAIGPEVHPAFRAMAVPGLGELLLKPSRRGTEYAMRKFLVYDGGSVPDEIVEYQWRINQNPWTIKSYLALVRNSRVLFLGQGGYCVPNRLKEVASPTLIVWGENDRIIPLRHGRLAEREIPNTRLVVFPRCGHMPLIEKAPEFNSSVAEFLSD